MKRLCKHWKRWVASLLIVTMFCGCLSVEGLAADTAEVVVTEDMAAETVEEQGIELEEVQETESEGESSYETRREDIIAELSTENSTTYDVGNGIHVAEFYAQNVRFRDESGELIDYDPSLVEISAEKTALGNSLDRYTYENKAGDKKQYFPEKLTEDTPVLLEQGEYQIRFAPLVSPIASDSEESTGNEMSQPEEVQDIELTEAVELSETTGASETANVVQAEEISEEPEAAEMELQVLESQEAVLQTVDMQNIYEEDVTAPLKMLYPDESGKIGYQYTSLENGVKEEIIIYEMPEHTEYAFLLEIPGLTIRKNPTSEGLTIYDGDKIVAGIQAPYMNDATGNAYSEDVTYSLETVDEEDGIYHLILHVDEDYLYDEERVYPVSIDPTLTWDDNSELSDVYVLSGYPSANHYVADATSFYLGQGQQGVSRCYIALSDLKTISKKYIESATLSLRECSNSLAGMTINAYRVTSGWDQTEISWYNQPNYDSTAVGTIKTKGSLGSTSMDLTSLFQKYVDGTYTNYGILLKNANESSNAYFTKFFGVRHATTSYRPKLVIVYHDRPAQATSVNVSDDCITPGQEITLSWAGINAGDLDYIQYSVAEYDEKNNKKTNIVTDYSTSTKIGTSYEGEAKITLGAGVASGSYKVYKVFVRGVATTGATGDERGVIVRVDNAEPTGKIRVLASGTGEEVTVLQDTVTIIGEVDGTGSPVVKNYMTLCDAEGNYLQDIYTNQTISKGQTVFTPELGDGNYQLKLYVEDSAGFKTEVTKEIEVKNTLAAPVIRSAFSNNGVVTLNWNFPYAATEVCKMAYRFTTEDAWTEVEDASGVTGSFDITLPDAEAVHTIRVCGVDGAGTYGAETLVTCTIDKTLPEAVLGTVDRGLVYGTIIDANLSSLEILLKQAGAETTETVIEGTRSICDA